VIAAVQFVLDGSRASTMLEGEKQFEIAVRSPQRGQGGDAGILDLPLDIINNQLMPAEAPGPNPGNPVVGGPRLWLRDLVAPTILE
jgi:hypothetical protein